VLERLGFAFGKRVPKFPNPPFAGDSHTPSSHIWNQQVKWGRLILFAFSDVFRTAYRIRSGTLVQTQFLQYVGPVRLATGGRPTQQPDLVWFPRSLRVTGNDSPVNAD